MIERRAVVLDPVVDVARLRATVADLQLSVETGRDALDDASGVVALLVGPEAVLTTADVAALRDLRLVVATSAGRDHLPETALREAGVEVADCAGYCTDEVADHTIALILDLLRAITVSDREVRMLRWSHQGRPRRIAGTRLAIVGLGRAGLAVATRGLALGMHVAAYDPYQHATGLAEVARVTTLPALLATCDVLTLHLPLRSDVYHLIGAAELRSMPKGSYLVNVARGGLVDEAAVVAAVRSGQLAGAAFDVLATEPPSADDELLQTAGVTLTPHSAWYSPDAKRRLTEVAGATLASRLAP